MNSTKEDFENWFRSSGYNENEEEDFLPPYWENSGLTYVEEFVECAYLAYLAGLKSETK